MNKYKVLIDNNSSQLYNAYRHNMMIAGLLFINRMERV